MIVIITHTCPLQNLKHSWWNSPRRQSCHIYQRTDASATPHCGTGDMATSVKPYSNSWKRERRRWGRGGATSDSEKIIWWMQNMTCGWAPKCSRKPSAPGFKLSGLFLCILTTSQILLTLSPARAAQNKFSSGFSPLAPRSPKLHASLWDSDSLTSPPPKSNQLHLSPLPPSTLLTSSSFYIPGASVSPENRLQASCVHSQLNSEVP